MCEAHARSGDTHPHGDTIQNHQHLEHDPDGDGLARPRANAPELEAFTCTRP